MKKVGQTKIILARHARATHNIYDGEGTFGGGNVDTYLTDEGKKQAEMIADQILQQGGCEKIISSNLKRSIETAQIIKKFIKQKTGREISLEQTELLNEANVGKFAGQTERQVNKYFPFASKNFYNGQVGKWDFPDGENIADLDKRADKLFAKIASENPSDKVLLVGHAIFNRVILHKIFPRKPEFWRPTGYSHNALYEFSIPKREIQKSILLIGWFFYPKIGGVETIMLNQALYFVSKGYRVAVLTGLANALKDEENYKGILILRRNFIDSSHVSQPSRISDEFGCILERLRPDVIYFHNGCYPAGSTDLDAGAQNVMGVFHQAEDRGIPILDYAHNAQLKNPHLTKKLRELKWDGLVCVSKFVLRKWRKLGFGAKRTFVVPNGIDTKRFSRSKPSSIILSLRKGDEIIIFFPSRILRISTGELSQQKNFSLVMKACAELVKMKVKNFRLVGVLDGYSITDKTRPAFRALNRLIGEYHLENNISFVPSVGTDKIPAYYKASDIVCVPSFYETFSLVHLEAMAAGKVAIASKTGGVTELIKNGVNGFLVDPNNHQELAEILHKIITDTDDLTKKISSQALITSEKFNLDKMGNELLEVTQKYFK